MQKQWISKICAEMRQAGINIVREGTKMKTGFFNGLS